MIKIAAITQGRYVPSARYRVRQLIPYLTRHHIQVKEFYPHMDLNPNIYGWPKPLRLSLALFIFPFVVFSRMKHAYLSRKYNITWLQREMIHNFLSFENFIGHPFVLDVDDAIWLSNKKIKQVPSFISRAEHITVGNSFLADWFEKFNRHISIVPTSVDTKYFVPAKHRQEKKHFIIGWIGTFRNLVYLEEIEKPINIFLKKHKNVILLIVSNTKPHLKTIPKSQLKFIKWSKGIEVSTIQNMDVGIMPLSDNEWTRGKCSFKMLQYMSCGVPVVASPVGMNREVLAKGPIGLSAVSIDDWLDAFEFLYQNRRIATKMGEEGRKVVISHYSSEVISKMLANIFLSLV